MKEVYSFLLKNAPLFLSKYVHFDSAHTSICRCKKLSGMIQFRIECEKNNNHN